MSCDRFKAREFNARRGAAASIQLIFSVAICISKLHPKSLRSFQFCKLISFHNSLHSLV